MLGTGGENNEILYRRLSRAVGRGVRWCRGRCGGREGEAVRSAPSPDRSEPLGCRRGNFFNPNAKITVDVHGAQAFNATLSSVSREGVGQSSDPSLPGRGEYPVQRKIQPGLHPSLDIRLFDAQGNVLAALTRNVP